MKRILLTLSLLSITLGGSQLEAATGSNVSAAQKVTATQKVVSYYAENYPGDLAAYTSLHHNQDRISDVAFFNYNATKEGNLVGVLPKTALQLTKDTKKGSFLVITNHGKKLFDKEIVHSILANKDYKARFIQQVLTTVQQNQLSGANLDFENVPAEDRQAYSSFVGSLADQLHAIKKQLIVSVPAKTNDDPAIFWVYGFDLKALGAKADYLQLMTYDEHGTWSEEGPVASYNWVEDVIRYSVSQVPAYKLLMGIPSYGYEWSTEKKRAISFRNIPAIIKENQAVPAWHDTYKSPYLHYLKNGVWHTLWYENEYSIAAKRSLALKYKLAGFAVWRLGYENDTFWTALLPKKS
ncbi:glycosyl hydrolase family 18 protein [Brevibacillus laterosporus]|uniref:glycosyl hydrolase family 18 protein n=1 Tax=Brevibacillus laterosporus TaxID=1465 RepID=UPI0003B1FA50|nr:glycosyl hydrolase family 18 protein [Brevibacillus laterosporus]ERM17695.1 glycoside hydrolase family 18 [Brevibacillus laterosporus PE36]